MNGSWYGNAAGVAAVLSWGALGVFGKITEAVDPRLVFAICFGIGAIIGGAVCVSTGRPLRTQLNRRNLAFAGLISAFHLLFFLSFRYAPALQVMLINYLWPALIIILGNLFFRLNSGWPGYAGAACGLAGVAVLLGADMQAAFQADAIVGYLLALSGAFVWAIYCNKRRTDRDDPIASTTAICMMSSLICAVSVLVGSPQLSMPGMVDVIAIFLLGLGPAGGAFFLWDVGMKRGNAAALAIFGYTAPLMSTVLMIAMGYGVASWNVLACALLIATGGLVLGVGNGRGRQGRRTDPHVVE